jgi:HAD superfamily hydrolase (TIGR01509 family)
LVLQIWRIHRHIGMGGDQLVKALTDERTEREHGDQIRAAEETFYSELIDEVEAIEGSRELIEELKRRGHTVMLASSAKATEVERYVDLLGARELADGWTTSADVEATKPEPDLVGTALQRAGGDGGAVMVGDTPWDVMAAGKVGVDTLAVLTGGFAAEELRAPGAVAVFESVAELCAALDSTALR